jgi:hypothetical protein
MHFSAHGHTAAEIVYSRACAEKHFLDSLEESERKLIENAKKMSSEQ